LDWLRANETLLWWVFSLSAAMFLGGLALMPVLLARMRHDYFVRRKPPEESWGGRHPAARLIVLIIKNSLGILLLLAGVAMLVLPGQGLLTILLALSLLNFPGKRKLELRIVRQRPLLKGINWIRGRVGRPPLVLPALDDDA
jgi:hypothetical protein